MKRVYMRLKRRKAATYELSEVFEPPDGISAIVHQSDGHCQLYIGRRLSVPVRVGSTRMRTQREEVSSPSEGETLVGSRVVGNPYLIASRQRFARQNEAARHHNE